MRRDSTTYTKSRQDAQRSKAAPTDGLWQHKRFGRLALAEGLRVLAAMAIGLVLFGLAYQIPVTHTVDIGGYDSAYVQGFYDPERNTPTEAPPALPRPDGTARWTPDVSY